MTFSEYAHNDLQIHFREKAIAYVQLHMHIIPYGVNDKILRKNTLLSTFNDERLIFCGFS